MTVFVDTSVLFDVLDASSKTHKTTSHTWSKALDSEDVLFTHNYVLVETLALIQNRLGMTAVTAFAEDVLPVLSIRLIDDVMHRAAMAGLLTASRRQISFVDCVSFQVMRDLAIKSALTLDPLFKQQGFRIYR